MGGAGEGHVIGDVHQTCLILSRNLHRPTRVVEAYMICTVCNSEKNSALVFFEQPVMWNHMMMHDVYPS